jgi:hypothetical protein
MPTGVDQDLLYRVKDLSDALQAPVRDGRLEHERLDAAIERLLAAADRLGAASVGARMAGQLATAEGLRDLLQRFGQGPRALDTAALTLGTIPVHSALDLCAGAILAVVDGVIPPPGAREAGMPALIRRAQRKALPGLFAMWLEDTLAGDQYNELDKLWRDPQTHRPVPTAVFAGAPSSDGLHTRASVRVYKPTDIDGHLIGEYLGSADERLPGFVDFGEQRFLALCVVLRRTYAPDRER